MDTSSEFTQPLCTIQASEDWQQAENGDILQHMEKHARARPEAQAIVIFFGACSGVDLGNMMVRTPWSMFALTSWGYRRTARISTSTSSATTTKRDSRGERRGTGRDAP